MDVSGRIVGAGADEFSMAAFTLAPGETRTQDVSFHPQRAGVKRAALAVTPCKGCGDLLVTLTGEGLELGAGGRAAVGGLRSGPTDFTATGVAVLRNLSTEPVTVTALAFAPGSDPDFSSGGTPLPLVIAGGATATVDLRYLSTHLGPASGTLVLSVDSVRHPTLSIPCPGRGRRGEAVRGAAGARVRQARRGDPHRLQVTVRNCGGPG